MYRFNTNVSIIIGSVSFHVILSLNSKFTYTVHRKLVSCYSKSSPPLSPRPFKLISTVLCILCRFERVKVLTCRYLRHREPPLHWFIATITDCSLIVEVDKFYSE
ncbi:hypothetical protein L195_g010508 [Trifolium pratense]|uniref:Uncharacterized protein n=1 Tax=Trifolium pratense TaxID=57577 RepID=A0A2K3PEW1_TRIPR|nr:hypothetical protein L195_g010508 [Trifolium pratense]